MSQLDSGLSAIHGHGYILALWTGLVHANDVGKFPRPDGIGKSWDNFFTIYDHRASFVTLEGMCFEYPGLWAHRGNR